MGKTSQDSVIVVGMMQLNACLYFWAVMFCFQRYYWPFYLIFAIVYTIRATYFFLLYADDSTNNRNNYYKAQKYSIFALFATALSFIGLKFVEFGHIPVAQTVAWILCAVCNWRNLNLLSDYYNQSFSRLRFGVEIANT